MFLWPRIGSTSHRLQYIPIYPRPGVHISDDTPWYSPNPGLLYFPKIFSDLNHHIDLCQAVPVGCPNSASPRPKESWPSTHQGSTTRHIKGKTFTDITIVVIVNFTLLMVFLFLLILALLILFLLILLLIIKINISMYIFYFVDIIIATTIVIMILCIFRHIYMVSTSIFGPRLAE